MEGVISFVGLSMFMIAAYFALSTLAICVTSDM
jgi:hypothetical protein